MPCNAFNSFTSFLKISFIHVFFSFQLLRKFIVIRQNIKAAPLEQPFTFDTNTIFLPRNIYINISDRIYSFCPKVAAGAADQQQITTYSSIPPHPFRDFLLFSSLFRFVVVYCPIISILYLH